MNRVDDGRRWWVASLWMLAMGCAPASEQLEARREALSGAPPPPRLMRDVAQVSDAGVLWGTGTSAPGLRTTFDGRLGLNVKAVTSLAGTSVIEFFLLNPEQAAVPGTLGLIGAEDAGANWFELDLGKVNVRHVTICDAATQLTSTSGTGADTYRLTLYGFANNNATGLTDVTQIDLSVTVTNPKTSAASATVSLLQVTPVTAVAVASILEPMFTDDGRLLVARADSKGQFTDDAGHPFTLGPYNIFYSLGAGSCRDGGPAYFSSFNPRPILSAPTDPALSAYGFAAQPMRDLTGKTVSVGGLAVPDLNGTYPWIDRKGRNLFFYSVKATNSGRFPLSCVVGTTCDATEDGSPTRGLTVMGSWTNGKAVLLDGVINNIDYGFGITPSKQAFLSLYSSGDPVRFASGRENLTGLSFPLGHAVQNPTIVDALENLHNGKAAWRPKTPRDVVWRVSRGHIADEVVFDDLLDPSVYLNAPMNAVVNLATGVYQDGSNGNPVVLQNQATSTRLHVPVSGKVSAGVRVEPAALGGINGRGLYLPSGGTAIFPLVVPGDAGAAVNSAPWYVGVYLDAPTVGAAGPVLSVGAFSVSVDAAARTVTLSDGVTPKVVPLAASLGSSWAHLGFLVTPGATSSVQVYLNGDASQAPVLFSSQTPFLPSSWAGRNAVLTGPSTGAWYDELKIIVSAAPLAEYAELPCNHAGGSIYQSAAGVSSCRTSLDGGVADHSGTSMRAHLLGLDALASNQPRPSFLANDFCLTCHFEAAGRPRALTLAALDAGTVSLEEDPRRQPMMPPRAMVGVYPKGVVDAVTPAGPDKKTNCSLVTTDTCNVDRWFFPPR